MAYHIKHGNRYSSGNTLTDREAKTVYGCLSKIVKIANKEGTYVGQKEKLYKMAQLMIDVIYDSDREYLLQGGRPAIYRNCFQCKKQLNWADTCKCYFPKKEEKV